MNSYKRVNIEFFLASRIWAIFNAFISSTGTYDTLQNMCIVKRFHSFEVRTRDSPSKSDIIFIIHCMTPLISHNVRLYKAVFPNGIDHYATPVTSRASSVPPSPSIQYSDSSSTHTAKMRESGGFFTSVSRLGGSFLNSQRAVNPVPSVPEGPIEELIVSGTAFGQYNSRGDFP